MFVSNRTAWKFILAGPPGAGKGTVAEALFNRGLEHVSSGETLRYEIERGTPLGRSIERRLSRGELVPDNEMLALMRKWFWGRDSKRGFVLDGFPRTLLQARCFDEWMEARGEALTACLLLELSEDQAVERIGGRRICPGCGSVYHVSYRPPEVSGKCDRCGEELVQRTDDQESVVRRRFRFYRETSRPVEAHYRSQGLLYVFSGERPAEEICRSIFDQFAEGRPADSAEAGS